jgi:hypothetical protein
VEAERLPAESRDLEALAPPGHLVTGTPRAMAFDESMVPGRPERVRAQWVGGTARARGPACDGGDRGVLGPGRKPWPLHVSGHRSASWGHGRAPLDAW